MKGKNNEYQVVSNKFSKMEKEVINIVSEYLAEYKIKFEYIPCKHKFSVPSVHFNLKGATAGMSIFEPDNGIGELDFNPILMKENWDEFRKTIAHEVAHHCVSLWKGTMYTKKGYRVQHGKDWKDMMNFFGIDSKRCHDYNVSNCSKKKQRQWNYDCGCRKHTVSTVAHNRIQKGNVYTCTECGLPLIFENEK